MKSCLKFLVLLYCLNFIEGGSFRCDYNYSSVADAWFKHFVIPATWFDARLRCALEGAALASPTTPKIRAEMIKIMKTFFTTESEVFTGIHATFSQGDYFTKEGVPLSEIPTEWVDYLPDNLENKESCITFNGDGKLSDRPCESTRPYICYRPKKNDEEVNVCGTVDPEYHLDQRTNHCYKLHTLPRSFKRAHFACSAEGGHLAIINSEIEAQVIRDIFTRYPANTMIGISWTDQALIGVNDWGEHGDWRTIHGQTLLEAGYNKFAAGQPNNVSPGQYCGSVFRTGLLNDVLCEANFLFICEKKPNYPAICHTTQSETKNSGCIDCAETN